MYGGSQAEREGGRKREREIQLVFRRQNIEHYGLVFSVASLRPKKNLKNKTLKERCTLIKKKREMHLIKIKQ
jgi:hypothetical protein